MTPRVVFERAPSIEVNETDDGYVIYDPAAEQAHFLNAVAAAAFELCGDGHSEDEIVAIFAEAGIADDEVKRCLEALQSANVIRRLQD
jgi:hypothetical protein